jgi:hypothetical protein
MTEENAPAPVVCCCPKPIKGMIIINAGCKIHGVKAKWVPKKEE